MWSFHKHTHRERKKDRWGKGDAFMRRHYSLTSTIGPPSPAPAAGGAAGASSSSPSTSSSSSSSSSSSAAAVSPRRVHPHFFVSVIFTLHLSRCLRRSLDGVCTYAQTSSFFGRPTLVNPLRSEEEALCRVLARVYRKLRLQKDTARGIQVRLRSLPLAHTVPERERDVHWRRILLSIIH